MFGFLALGWQLVEVLVARVDWVQVLCRHSIFQGPLRICILGLQTFQDESAQLFYVFKFRYHRHFRYIQLITD
jgi:hypothetical protein